jgi:hypothetical protein
VRPTQTEEPRPRGCAVAMSASGTGASLGCAGDGLLDDRHRHRFVRSHTGSGHAPLTFVGRTQPAAPATRGPAMDLQEKATRADNRERQR